MEDSPAHPKSRYLAPSIKEFLGKKIILLSGPRQVGKTTLACSLDESTAYYNYDIKKDLAVFRDQQWDRAKKLVVFDELHKMWKWKLWLKGLYDDGILKRQQVLVTGSARLDVAKKMGDSLAGRAFTFRLHPFDLKELKGTAPEAEIFERLMKVSGFPEPYLEGTERFYGLWARSHLDLILRQDLITTEAVRDIDGIEVLIELLASRVGSIVSYNSLREDLRRDDKTIKRWIMLLERLFVLFRVPSYAKNIALALSKSSKFYFYDLARVTSGDAGKLENLVALALRKELDYKEDTMGTRTNLYFGRTKSKHEMDFIIEQNRKITHLIEVKSSGDAVSPQFAFFGKYFPSATKLQLGLNLEREFSSKDGVEARKLVPCLSKLAL